MTKFEVKILPAVLLCAFATAFAVHDAFGQPAKAHSSEHIILPNGWGLSPAGTSIQLGDLPLNIAVSRTRKLAAVTNNGQSNQTIMLIDAEHNRVLDSVDVDAAWLGLVFSSDEHWLFASGGNDNWILRFAIVNRKLVVHDTIPLGAKWPTMIAPAGMAFDDNRRLLYVVTREDNALYIVDVDAKRVVKKIALDGEGYTCMLSPAHDELYVSCWGCNRVLVLDTKSQQFVAAIPVGDHPNDLCLTADGHTLFVANAADNSVSVIAVQDRAVIETLNAALFPDAPEGSTTNSLALDGAGKTLFVANADNNCLAVFDVRHPGSSLSRGFIPSGWYPTCVRVVHNSVLVTCGKGYASYANPHGPNPMNPGERVQYQAGDTSSMGPVQYIAGLMRGRLEIIPVPDDRSLATYSQSVYHNVPYTKLKESSADGAAGNPVPMRVDATSPIKYVFYVIKENRTYDQVLGDIPQGNGDTSLVLFGEHVTPNQHALARQFVLCDNFYVDGEVSADGHNWSTGAYANDFLEKTWPESYGGRGGSYNSEGEREIANNKSGFIWAKCKKYGVSYRTYGEFVTDGKPNIPVLEGHCCSFFTSWHQSVYDTTRFQQWRQDFDSLLMAGSVPRMNTIRFINDHTEGLQKGKLSPIAHVADNDRATGLLVECLAHSSIWDSCAVFIVEDDAQNGPDHVDAHRSTVYVAGGMVKRGVVDHTPYSTSSVLRTMELILGLPPMSQYDAAATPLWRCFSSERTTGGFISVPPQVDLSTRNTASNSWQRMSEGFDFAKEDQVPDKLFNSVLWAAIKGESTPCPAPRRAAFVRIHGD